MSGSQRGEKRACPSCGVRFYDLARRPIACPGCGSEFSVDDFVRPRRQRAPEPSPEKSGESAAAASPAAKGAGESAPVEDMAAAEANGKDVEDDDEDESVIEDASELGEDDDDMAEVIVRVVEPEKTEER